MTKVIPAVTEISMTDDRWVGRVSTVMYYGPSFTPHLRLPMPFISNMSLNLFSHQPNMSGSTTVIGTSTYISRGHSL